MSASTWCYTGVSLTSEENQYWTLIFSIAQIQFLLFIFFPHMFMFSLYCSSGCYKIKILGVSMMTLNRLKYLNHFSACQTLKIYELLVFCPLAHLSQSKHAHKVVVTCWLTVLLFALLGYFSPVVISRPMGELQLQSGNMDFSFLLLWRRKRSGDARGSRLLSRL